MKKYMKRVQSKRDTLYMEHRRSQKERKLREISALEKGFMT